MRDILDEVERWRESGEPVALATVVGGTEAALGRRLRVSEEGALTGSLGEGYDETVAAQAREALAAGAPRRLEPTPERAAEIFIDVLQPPLRLIVVGGVHIA